jgi:flagellin-like protein
MNFKKLLRSRKAISPIISTLLLIAIAVVASLVAYAWVMGYIGFQTAKTGQAIQIQSVSDSGGVLTVYVQNVGQAPVSFNSNCIFVNGTVASGLTASSNLPIPVGNTVTFTTTNGVTLGSTVTVKAISADGTFNSLTYTFTS